MTLSDFIEANLDRLIDDWAMYAGQISDSETRLTETELRDSAGDLLRGIAADMRRSQDSGQQEAKSHNGGVQEASFNDIARQHANDRLGHGFGINDVIAEFRALRASVLRRWEHTLPGGAASFQEMIRFNEAIDQALAQSVRRHAQGTERTRDLFAGVLAHDLRSPLGAIINSAEVILRDEGLSARGLRSVANVRGSAARMKRMIDDLLVFTRTRLGNPLPVELTSQDIGRICSDAAEEVRAAYPDAQIDVRVAGELKGQWDGIRIAEIVVNLLVNAVQYGAGPICVQASGDDGHVTLAVSNEGKPIPRHALPTLFDPLTRVTSSSAPRWTAAGMGLGLYICRCIAHAHGGTISVDSTDAATTFTVRMPRYPSPPA